MGETLTSGWQEGGSQPAGARMRVLVMGAYACFLLAVIGSAFFQPAHDWDMIGFAAVITSWQTPNPAEIQSKVYQQLRRTVPPATY